MILFSFDVHRNIHTIQSIRAFKLHINMSHKEFRKNWNIVDIVTDFLHVINYCSVCVTLEGNYNNITVGDVKNDPRGAYYCTNPLFEKQEDQREELFFQSKEELLAFLEQYKDKPVADLEIYGLHGYP